MRKQTCEMLETIIRTWPQVPESKRHQVMKKVLDVAAEEILSKYEGEIGPITRWSQYEFHGE